MDIFKEIKKEHDAFKKMADKISASSDEAIKKRTVGFAKLKTELTAHHEAVEAILVPVLKEKIPQNKSCNTLFQMLYCNKITKP